MIRYLGPFAPNRPFKLNAPILTMLLNAVQDRHGGRVFVLQVGAGTGQGGLPLLSRFRDAGWSGLLIEPHPKNFAQLDALHQDADRVAILNLAISDISASLPLHFLTPEAEARQRRAPRGRASLVRTRIAQPGIAAEDLQEVEVPVLRLDTVLEELGIDAAQVLAVNAGGHEAEVLASFDLSALAPSLVFVQTPARTPIETACVSVFTSAGFIPFRLSGWLVGLAPGHLALPLEELLTFFNKGLSDAEEDDE